MPSFVGNSTYGRHLSTYSILQKACHYCNFHFSTQTADMQVFVDTLIQEIALQKSYIKEPIETIYFGGERLPS